MEIPGFAPKRSRLRHRFAHTVDMPGKGRKRSPAAADPYEDEFPEGKGKSSAPAKSRAAAKSSVQQKAMPQLCRSPMQRRRGDEHPDSRSRSPLRVRLRRRREDPSCEPAPPEAPRVRRSPSAAASAKSSAPAKSSLRAKSSAPANSSGASKSSVQPKAMPPLSRSRSPVLRGSVQPKAVAPRRRAPGFSESESAEAT